MNDLSDLLAPDAVVSGLAVRSKKALFQQLAVMAGARLAVDSVDVAAKLAAREKLGSTGFGGGIAIPHARIDGLDRVRGLFVRLAAPVDFQAVDGLPVDLAFMLLSPRQSGADHLKALARVSRRLRDRPLTEKLRGAGSTDAIYALLSGFGARDAVA